MSERNQSLLIVCGFVLVGTALRMYFGYEQWDTVKDVTSILTITGIAGASMQLSRMVVKE
jgi:hypothetical protein